MILVARTEWIKELVRIDRIGQSLSNRSVAHLLCAVEVMVIRRALHDVKLLETKRIIRPLPIRAVAAPIQTRRWYEAIFGVGIVVTTFSVGAVVLV